MEHMTLEIAQLRIKVGSKGVPVISDKLQTIKKKQPKLWLLMATVDNLSSGC